MCCLLSPGHGSSFSIECHICSCFAGDTICSTRECLGFDSSDEDRRHFTGPSVCMFVFVCMPCVHLSFNNVMIWTGFGHFSNKVGQQVKGSRNWKVASWSPLSQIWDSHLTFYITSVCVCPHPSLNMRTSHSLEPAFLLYAFWDIQGYGVGKPD